MATSQIFILGIPAQLAATWFPPDQTSTATSIGVFGNQVGDNYGGRYSSIMNIYICFQLGIAVGFVLPAVLVADQDVEDNYHLIGHDLFVMFLGVAIFTTILLVSIIFGKFPIPVQIYFLASLSKTFFCQISCLKYFLTFSSLITQFLPVWISINALNNWKNFPLSFSSL